MIISPGKTDRSINDITFDNLCIVTQLEAVMMVWFNGMVWKNIAKIRAQKNKRDKF